MKAPAEAHEIMAPQGVAIAFEEILRQLKDTYRDPAQQPPSPATYQKLARYKLMATRAYALRAHARGRVHLQGKTMAEQATWILEQGLVPPTNRSRRVSWWRRLLAQVWAQPA